MAHTEKRTEKHDLGEAARELSLKIMQVYYRTPIEISDDGVAENPFNATTKWREILRAEILKHPQENLDLLYSALNLCILDHILPIIISPPQPSKTYYQNYSKAINAMICILELFDEDNKAQVNIVSASFFSRGGLTNVSFNGFIKNIYKDSVSLTGIVEKLNNQLMIKIDHAAETLSDKDFKKISDQLIHYGNWMEILLLCPVDYVPEVLTLVFRQFNAVREGACHDEGYLRSKLLQKIIGLSESHRSDVWAVSTLSQLEYIMSEPFETLKYCQHRTARHLGMIKDKFQALIEAMSAQELLPFSLIDESTLQGFIGYLGTKMELLINMEPLSRWLAEKKSLFDQCVTVLDSEQPELTAVSIEVNFDDEILTAMKDESIKFFVEKGSEGYIESLAASILAVAELKKSAAYMCEPPTQKQNHGPFCAMFKGYYEHLLRQQTEMQEKKSSIVGLIELNEMYIADTQTLDTVHSASSCPDDGGGGAAAAKPPVAPVAHMMLAEAAQGAGDDETKESEEQQTHKHI